MFSPTALRLLARNNERVVERLLLEADDLGEAQAEQECLSKISSTAVWNSRMAIIWPLRRSTAAMPQFNSLRKRGLLPLCHESPDPPKELL